MGLFDTKHDADQDGSEPACGRSIHSSGRKTPMTSKAIGLADNPWLKIRIPSSNTIPELRWMCSETVSNR